MKKYGRMFAWFGDDRRRATRDAHQTPAWKHPLKNRPKECP